MKPSDATVLIVDSGWYCELGPRLALEYGTVLYWSPWQGSDFPYSADAKVGTGLEGVTRVRDLWDAIPMADLVVFPGQNHADLQGALVAEGKPVWGSRRAEELEIDRVAFKQHLAAEGLPVIPYETIRGLKALRKWMEEDNGEAYIKLARGYRGDMETHHFTSWALDSVWWYDLAARMGPVGDGVLFVIEPPVEGFEGGCDWINVNGEYAKVGMIGYEIKDSCYVSTTKPLARLAPALRAGLDCLSDHLRATEYKQLISTEVRIAEDGTAYFIDAALRFPWPPSGSIMENCENLGEIIWWAATNGTLVQPKWRHKYGVELNVTSPWLTSRWQPVQMPLWMRRYVKLHNAMKFGDTYWIKPQHETNGETGGVGTVIATADSLDEAREQVTERVKLLEGIGLKYQLDDINKAEQEIEKGNEAGIAWEDVS